MKHLFALIYFCLISTFIYSQTGKVTGKIVDAKTGETLPGATILLEGTTKGVSTDFDGNFSLNNLPVGKITLIASYISYDSKKITGVNVVANDVTNINVSLNASSSQDLSEVVVQAEVNKENNVAMVMQQKNNTSLSDGVSAEAIKRTPDRTTADVLKRISGVTIQEDKFVVVRGLNDRYNASYLNGSPLPSTEPDRKAFAFDLFPSNMLDNIMVNKTATPDMPGEFAGGIILVNTKSIPEKNFFSVTASGGYNTLATNKDKTIYDGGKYDKFGFDDGSRNLPSEVPSYLDKSTWITNKDQARMATYFNNDWAYSQKKASPNYSGQIAGGYSFKLKERDFFGLIFSLSNTVNQESFSQKIIDYTNLSANFDNSGTIQQEQNWNQKTSQTKASTGALLNLSCKLNNNNSIQLKNIYSGNSDNKFIQTLGNGNVNDAAVTETRNNARYFAANKILTSQLIGEHFLPKAKIRINWNGGYSTVKRTVPDLRYTSYTRYSKIQDPNDPNPFDTIFSSYTPQGSTTGPGYSGYRVYSKLNENIKSFKTDVSRLFKINSDFKIEGKLGGLYQIRQREFEIRQFGLKQYNYTPGGIYFDYNLTYLPEDQMFAAQNMSVTPDGKGGFALFEFTKPDDNYKATTTLFAYYAMAEIKYKEKLRLIGGVRVENFNQQINVQFNIKDSVFVKNQAQDILPSINAVYNINEKLGIRLAYYKTLNRPELRELAPANWFDPETRLNVAGNPNLKRCYIENMDARFEVYPGRGQLFTISGFYKYFSSPIERYVSPGDKNQIEYRNVNSGNIMGGELEYRLNVGAILKTDSIRFLNNLNLFSNLSLMKSEVDVTGINDKVPAKRQMQGQAPYIVNAGISYIDTKYNFSVSGIVNRIGPRIYLVGSDVIPNRWENPRTVLDFQLTKSFLKNKLELRFNIKDLLHQDWVIFYSRDNKGNYNSSDDYLNFTRTTASVYSFQIVFRL